MTNETNHEQSSSAENCTTTISTDELTHFDEIIQPTVIEHNPSLTGLARLNPGIVYKEIDGEKLMMDVLQPQVPNGEHPHFPTVLFIQGSAFQTPDRNYEIPQLAELARRGFVIATVNHRNCTQGHPFPAFMEDVKAALRFLRAHSDDMFIDPERIGVWGTSSGGTTSLLMGLTSGLNMYNDGSHAEMSDKVTFAVDCFGISEPRDMIPHPEDLSADLNGIWVKLLGVSDLSEASFASSRIDELSAMHIVQQESEGRTYPPFLLLHGDSDGLVPYEQSQKVALAMKKAGVDVSFVRVSGADHEYDFWSQKTLDTIFTFIENHA